MGVPGPAGQPAAQELLRQLAPGLSGERGGRALLVLVARSGPGSPGAAGVAAADEEVPEGEKVLRALWAGAGLHEAPGARVLGLLLQAPPAQGGMDTCAQLAGPAAAKAAGWPGVGALAMVQLGCAPQHDVQLLRSLLEAACGLPVAVRGRAAAAAEAPAPAT